MTPAAQRGPGDCLERSVENNGQPHVQVVLLARRSDHNPLAIEDTFMIAHGVAVPCVVDESVNFVTCESMLKSYQILRYHKHIAVLLLLWSILKFQ